jgi:hypothetical protein
MGCPEFGREDRANLNIFFERTQGHFLSPCSRHGSLCTKQPRQSLSSPRNPRALCRRAT